jgi:hypothetical protein
MKTYLCYLGMSLDEPRRLVEFEVYFSEEHCRIQVMEETFPRLRWYACDPYVVHIYLSNI